MVVVYKQGKTAIVIAVAVPSDNIGILERQNIRKIPNT